MNGQAMNALEWSGGLFAPIGAGKVRSARVEVRIEVADECNASVRVGIRKRIEFRINPQLIGIARAIRANVAAAKIA